ncbi:MAG: DUF1152 domain-containing protein [Solirubrobacterales bacterium]|nr:DUF1152 domain-containing protein [Solirubrobacterales bacterium]
MSRRGASHLPDELGRGEGGALVVGIGGGGDVVGAIAVAREIERSGRRIELGGVAWERFAVDPHHAGPRPLEHLSGIDRVGAASAVTGADGRTPEGVRLAEAGVAAHLGRPVALIDANPGPAAIAAGLESAADRLGCDLIVLLDVGGDVLATGSEPGLSSPLCDAMLLAASRHLPERIDVLGCAFGSGCDGELTTAEVLDRVAALARSGAWTGTLSPTSEAAREVVRVAAEVPTEASLLAARCALGETGTVPIRGGRRSVELGPLGALGFVFDARRAIGPAAPLAELIHAADSIEEARALMEAEGIRTELDYERERVGRA